MATAKTDDVFETLRLVDVSEHVEEKDTGKAKLKYLSWAWAWHEVRRRYPNATYTIVKNENGLPYFVDPQMGIMVYTTVTIGDETHEMWLPVMDGANNPMRLEPYDIVMKWGKKHIEAATMFDINKTVMRCLTKNLAMFGIGLALYAGEDLFDDPEGNKGVEAENKPEPKKTVTKKTEPAPVAQPAETPGMSIDEMKKALGLKIGAMAKTLSQERQASMANWLASKLGDADWRKCTDAAALASVLKELQAA
jgi:hypothetical protein